jgi:two-component system sensor histidine kinase ChiS
LKINSVYGRFVPHDILRFLNKESIIEVKLGDGVQMEMAVFVSDMRAFATTSEK